MINNQSCEHKYDSGLRNFRALYPTQEQDSILETEITEQTKMADNSNIAANDGLSATPEHSLGHNYVAAQAAGCNNIWINPRERGWILSKDDSGRMHLLRIEILR
jgi:hypothetical protein